MGHTQNGVYISQHEIPKRQKVQLLDGKNMAKHYSWVGGGEDCEGGFCTLSI